MTALEIVLAIIALAAAYAWWHRGKQLETAYKDQEQAMDYLLDKLKKARHDADKDYESTGWAPGSDKPPTSL